MAKMSERWAFRVAPPTDEIVRQAASASDQSLTDFVVEAAVVEAERVLADRTSFTLQAKEWTRFVELLDRPPRESPGLERLFAAPSIFSSE